MTKVYVDIETYSAADLPKVGVYRYAADPAFLILLAAWSVDGGPVEVDTDPAAMRARLQRHLDDPDTVFVAHNAAFERVCFSALLGMPPGAYLPPERWHDTQAVAAQQGWPQGLGMLARALGGERKDEAGTRLINLFSKPSRKGTRTLPAERPDEWLDYMLYCVQDVVTLVDVHQQLGGHATAAERQVFLTDQRINDRGISIDVPMARTAVQVAERNAEELKFEFVETTGYAVANPSSVQQVRAWLLATGLTEEQVPDLKKATVQALLDGPLDADQRRALELRQDLALVASKKFASASNSALEDGRLRGSFRYFGAHTGRWAGRGVQLQNLPREQLETEAETAAAIDRLKRHHVADSYTLKALVRALFTGPFTVVDYSAIEARVLAWLAGEQWALDAFRAGRDIYVETAERMGGLTRSQGKVAVLALGYNGGINSLKAMGGARTYYDPATNLVVPAGEVTPDTPMRDMHDEEYRRLVEQWRRANSSIVRLWAALGDAFGDGGKVGQHLEVSASHDAMGRAVHLHLPSGRAISYRGTKWERYRQPAPDGRMVAKEGWRYADPRNPFNAAQRIGTYGGRLAENATQAVARDILAEALVRLEERGYRVVGHVHDEVLVEGEHDVDEVAAVMSELPSWATDLPIAGEGYTADRYRK